MRWENGAHRAQASCATPAHVEVVEHVVVAPDGEEFAERAAELGHALA